MTHSLDFKVAIFFNVKYIENVQDTVSKVSVDLYSASSRTRL